MGAKGKSKGNGILRNEDKFSLTGAEGVSGRRARVKTGQII